MPGLLWRLPALLPRDRCRAIILRAREYGFQRARLEDQGRRNGEMFLDWPSLRAALTRCLRRCAAVPPLSVLGTAVLGPRLECYEYGPGDEVAPHQDARCLVAARQWSEWTLVVYLDDGAEGGDTLFPDHGVHVRPVAGSGLLFAQSLLHAAARVTRGCKHVLRTDVAAGARAVG